jgi:DMSO/TMAO reductase YedYZ molybdopterin-dependent catalytic subunit
MSGLTRRRLITTGLAAAAGATGLAAAARIAAHYGLVPPDHGGIYGAGATLTYASQRLLTAGQSLAREFDRSQISAVAPVNGDPPRDEEYRRLRAGGFAEWRLEIDGLVARPGMLSLDELKRLPRRSQVTMQACEEGWSFIAEWIGVALSDVLTHVGMDGRAKFVVFYPFDDYWDSLDLADAYHPQTLLAYGMNGAGLPDGHGAPLRLRVARQLGYKSIKYLSRISVVDSLKDIGQGLGSGSPEIGYSWYAGI